MARYLLALAALGAACGKSGDNGNGGTGPTPSISITLSTSSLTIVQGGTDNLTASIARAGGFTGAVTIVTEGAPTGVTAAASNVSTSGSVTTGTITVTVGAAVAPGTYNLTVRASGSGVTEVTRGITLTVTATPVIAIALSASAQSVDQGATGAAITVTITRTNFGGTVNLSVDGAPAGLTAQFTPAGATGNTSTLALSVGGAVAGGVYNLTIRGAGAGVTDATAPLALTVTVPASFTLAVAPVSITQGAQGPTQVTITRVNFTAGVTLTLEGAPAGVTGGFDPTPATGAASTLTLTVGGSVPAAQYTLTVRGASAGQTDRTATFTLTVTPFVAIGSYALSVIPTSGLLVATGSGGSAFVVNVNRTGGFTGPVTLAATGLLGSLTATIIPSVVTGNSAVVKVVPDQSSLVGSSQATITGTTPGLPDKIAQIQITTALPNMTFDYSACTTSIPVALWYQDGVAGPWIQLLPLNGKFQIKLTQPKVGFAVSSPSFGGGGQPPWVRLRSAAELQAFSGHDFCDDGNPGPNSVNVSGTGFPTVFDQAIVEFGGAQHSLSDFLSSVTITGALAGTHDLFARSVNQNGNPGPTDRIIIRRGLTPANGGTIAPALNFDPTTGEGFAPSTTTITVGGLQGGEIVNSTGTLFYTAGSGGACDAAPLYARFFAQAISSFTAYGVPAIKQLPTDMTRIEFDTQGSGSFRQVSEYVHTLAPHTITLGSSLPVPTVTSIPGPTFRLQFTFTLPSDLVGSLFANYTTASGQLAFLDASAAWVGGSSVVLAMPDYSQSAGFVPATLQPPSSLTSNWIVTAQGPQVNPCAGPGTVAAANRSGTFAIP
jgi:hypothetical protein